MTQSTRYTASAYMEWAKLKSHAPFNLATSGIMSCPLAELSVTIADLEINGPTVYGYTPLQQRLAAKSGVQPENVVASAGASLANHLAIAAAIEPGDEVLIEQPTYSLLVDTASYLGANVRRFTRTRDSGFQIDLDEVRRNFTSRTRLIVITNLHNPTGAYTDEPTLTALGELAATVGARVLVDEVYLDMLPEQLLDWPARSSFNLGPNFLVTNSLTKSYGLSGIRCGWILADPEMAKRIWRLNDLYSASPVFPAEQIAVFALDRLPRLIARTRALLAANHAAVDQFIASHPALDLVRPLAGTVLFPRLKTGSVEDFTTLLRDKYETSVVPGHFFEMPDHFRIGLGGDPVMTREGLSRLAQALDDFTAS
jgi:aspartate/methionine/tyrosine aminotransferase